MGRRTNLSMDASRRTCPVLPAHTSSQPPPPTLSWAPSPQSLPGVFKVMPGVSEKSLMSELMLMYYGRGLTSWWGCGKPGILTVVLWIPRRRRLMGTKRGEGSARNADFHAQRTASPPGQGRLVLKTSAPTLRQARAPAPSVVPQGSSEEEKLTVTVMPVARDGDRGSHGL